jgi:flagellar biogenesis protein FliO
VSVVNIILILWVIVFAFWLVRQFADYNKRSEK